MEKDLDDIYFLAGLDDNVFVQAKVNNIRRNLLHLIKNTPNDMELGAKIRKLI